MRRLIDQLHGRDRCIVVVDLPPVRLGDDVVALAPYLDGLLVVVREGVTAVNELKESVELLKDFPILGTVLNQSSARKLRFEGYYYNGSPELK
jgi:Mrp family chromosome partitioning ATPase